MSDSSKEISSNLTLSDLKVINTIIELISTKGLVRPADFVIIGNIYEKINALLQSVQENK